MVKLEKRMKRKKILVIGDVMLDEYNIGTVSRISPEAPVPVFLEKSKRYSLGGAANVAANLAVNGMEVSVLSVIGEDDSGKKLEKLFEESKIETELLVKTSRPTPTKCRLLAGNNQQVIRIDSEDSREIDKELEKKMEGLLRKALEQFEIVVLSDYEKGVLSFGFTRKIIEICKKREIKTLVDVKGIRAGKYEGSFLIKPNKKELSQLTSMNVLTVEEVYRASEELQKVCKSEYILTTCGADGMVLSDTRGMKKKFEATTKEVFDVTGAGDTVIAYLSMCIANGFEVGEAVSISNIAAGIQVSKVGTSRVELWEVDAALRKEKNREKDKLIDMEGLRRLRGENSDKKIVFTNGCFDILHTGHIRYLREAAALGNILVVGINSDSSVKRLKGLDRPINNQNDRAEMLAAYDFIDKVVIFNENTPYEVIKECKPDILVKGGDYEENEVVGKE